MRKISEVPGLRLSAGLSFRQISASTKLSVGAIQNSMSLRYKNYDQKLWLYAVPTVPIVNAYTGELWNGQVFVTVSGASDCTFVEVSASKSNL